MTNLIELNASYGCGIGDNGIKDLNLVILNADGNSKITNVNHMSKLKELDANFDCGIDDDGIKDLNLIKLAAEYNQKIGM